MNAENLEPPHAGCDKETIWLPTVVACNIRFTQNVLNAMNRFPDYTRRHFIATSSLAVAGAFSSNVVFAKGKNVKAKGGPVASFTPNKDTLKIGLIGCGGRGSGAAANALNADENTMLVAMADAFPDQLNSSLEGISNQFGARVKVDPEHRFVGLDAYKKLIDSDVDVVLMASPPGFRPMHLEYAVAKNKHIFTEKPMAVDGPGIRSVLKTVAESKKNNKCLVAGFCWRYHYPKRETFKQLHDGAIGDIRTIYTTYNTGRVGKESAPWNRQNTKSLMEWMVRRWYFFTWLSGDHIVEQAVHSIDKMSWAMGDTDPISCIATGGRQVRTEPECGNIYDHFAVVYDYPKGVKGFHFSRQQDRCDGTVQEDIAGTKGMCHMKGAQHMIVGENKWKYDGAQNDMYQTEHDEMFAAIREGKVINNGDRMIKSTTLAVMGRMAAYTGKVINWEEAINSKESIVPADMTWDAKVQVPEVAMPGHTPFV
jgi:myo-inositol 2-dehydrogenase/D-chiro-inositol 1-dehydrogenase